MTHGTLNIERLTELCGALCDRVIDADSAAELDAMLANDPIARRIYGVIVDTHLDLEADAMRGESISAAPVEPMRMRSPWVGYARAAAVVLAAATIGIVIYVMNGGSANDPVAPKRPVAVLVEAVGVSWASEPMYSGDEIVPGTLRIDRGRIDLTMHSGVTVTAVGPAELTLQSRGRCVLTRGQVTANVPQRAIGFTLATPHFTVVDLGTEFGVRVRSDGSGEVRVFDGSVSVDDGRKRIVTAGHGRRYTVGGAGEDFAVTSRWRDDAPRIVHYRFDEGEVDPILDSGFGFAGGPFDIEIIKRRQLPHRVEGVFGKALALRLGESFDSGFVGIGGGAERTVAFWVKVPENARDDQAQAVVSWGDAKSHGGAWQIGWDRWNAEHKGSLRVFAGDRAGDRGDDGPARWAMASRGGCARGSRRAGCGQARAHVYRRRNRNGRPHDRSTGRYRDERRGVAGQDRVGHARQAGGFPGNDRRINHDGSSAHGLGGRGADEHEHCR